MTTPAMRIAVVSDTHGNVRNTQTACELIRPWNIATVLHCGDIGGLEIIPLFEEWPTHFVFGNVDDNPSQLRTAIENENQTCHGRYGELTLSDCQIAFLHGDDWRLLEHTILSGQYDLVCHGHTHVPRNERIGRTLVLNPGALHRANPHSFAIVTLPEGTVEHISLPPR